MSHHFDSPTGREDPRLNLCDAYLFAGGEANAIVMALTVNPAAIAGTAMPFRGEAIYTFHFDTDRDGHENVSFAVEFAVSTEPTRRRRKFKHSPCAESRTTAKVRSVTCCCRELLARPRPVVAECGPSPASSTTLSPATPPR